MASLTGQSVAASYEQLLHVDRDGGGNTTTLVDVKDGDNGTTFALKLAQYHAEIRGTTGTGATGAGKLNLSTAELTVVDNDVLGRIDFLAPLESSGTDAILAGASIWGEAEDTFAADNNSTALVFATNTSAAATERMRITSAGKLFIGKASSGFGATGIEISADGTFWGTKADGNPVGLNRTGSAGSVFEWYDDASIKGAIGTATSYFLNNVGIGTSSPATNLHVKTTAGNHGIEIESDSAAVLTFDHAGNDEARILFKEADTTEGSIIYTSTGTDTMQFKVGSNGERMRITGGGNVLIGHTAAIDVGQTGSFQVNGTDNDSGSMSVVNWGNNSAHFAQIHLAHSKSNAKGTNTTLADNDAIGGIFFRGADGSDFETISASIVSNVDGSVATSRVPADLIFSTAAGASDDDVAERMRIMSNGNVGIGGTPNGEANLLVHSGDANASQIYITNTDTGIGDSAGFVIGLENDEGARINKLGSGSYLRLGTNGVHRMILDDNSRISLSNNDSGGVNNTVFGYNAFASADSGATGNTALGDAALYAGNVAGEDNNTAIGFNAGFNCEGAENVYVGKSAGGGGVGAEANNVGVGASALSAVTTGSSNVAVGKGAGALITSGGSNVIIGVSAGDATVDSSNHVLIGAGAGGNGDIASDGQTAVGYLALHALTSGTTCTAVGAESLDANDTGNSHTAVGYQALSATNGAKHGATAIGYKALHQNVSGATNDYSVGVGFESGDNQTTGYQNTFLGASTTGNDASAVNQTVIGYHAQGKQNNSVTLGNDAVTDVFMGDDSGALVNCSGIVFPADQVPSGGANALDDYEEGDHTATVVGATSGNFVVNSTNDILRYTKIGRLVNIQGLLVIDSDNSNSGQIKVSLPFTIGDGTGLGGRSYGSAFLDAHGGTIAGQVYAKLSEGNAFFTLVEVADNGTANDLDESDVDGAFNIGVNFSYTV